MTNVGLFLREIGKWLAKNPVGLNVQVMVDDCNEAADEADELALRLMVADKFVCRLAYRGDVEAQAYAESHGYDWRNSVN